MRLVNINIIRGNGAKHLRVTDGRISVIAENEGDMPSTPGECSLFFTDAIAFPGLINSHDHLDFNLFPAMRNTTYPGYHEWGKDIHLSDHEKIAAVLAIPRPLRVRWGMYKNLLNGITTVVHHGSAVEVAEDVISVNQEATALHSISGEKRWRQKLLWPFRHRRLVIHAGEGTTAACSQEITQLIRWNIFHKELIAVHGIAMDERQAAAFRALVWCPYSNEFLYGTTAPISRLRHHTAVVFGTDSTLTASWNLWEHLRLARRMQLVDDGELWDMLTRTPAMLWGGPGSLEEGFRADVVIARASQQQQGWDGVYSIDPQDILLVLHKGEISLFDSSLYSQLYQATIPASGFYPIGVGTAIKYVQGNLPRLMQEIRRYYPAVEFPVRDVPPADMP